ncbi:ATP-binding protein [Streptomyces sp. 8K308]|uniref:ATP-binding protein n=1 Tax=Streptomyces sp. 8K308 TaxID=2530388 RepID=UPI001FB5901F|nr:ATP-binding protein [Streptomyces sp. 8K308]
MYREPQPIPLTESWFYELQFPRDPRGPRIARLTLRTVLTHHGLDELTDRAEVLTSELATNAVCHTTGPASVSLTWAHPTLRVSVWDACPTLPAMLPDAALPLDAVGGRGLFLLDRLADRWGGCAIGDGPWGPGGKTLWFKLLLGNAESAAAAAA